MPYPINKKPRKENKTVYNSKQVKNRSNVSTYIALIVTAVLLFTVCLGSYLYLEKSSDYMLAYVPQIEKSIIENNWQQVDSEFKEIKDYWDKHKDIWQCIILHQEIDDIETEFMLLQGYILTQNKSDGLSSLYKLEYTIDHVPDTEKITFYNIL